MPPKRNFDEVEEEKYNKLLQETQQQKLAFEQLQEQLRADLQDSEQQKLALQEQLRAELQDSEQQKLAFEQLQEQLRAELQDSEQQKLALQDSEQQKLALQEQLRAEIREKENLQEEIIAKDLKIKALTRSKGLSSGSYVSRFQYVIENIPFHSNAGFTWATPSQETCNSLWEIVKDEAGTDIKNRIPIDVSTLNDENLMVHPAFAKLLSTISLVLHRAPLNCHQRPVLTLPNFIPDLVITRNGITSCTWQEAYCVVELKTASGSFKDAVGQCAGYCNTAHEKMSSLYTNRIGIASNLLTIMFLYMPTDIMEMTRSEELELFPNGWLELKEPSEGFQLLCHALNFKLPGGFSVELQRDGKTIQTLASKILLNDDCCLVAVCNINGEKIVVKKTENRYGKGVFGLELSKYALVSKIEGIDPFIVRLRPELQVKNGFAMDYATGESLEAWLEQAVIEHEAKTIALKKIFLHVLRGLKLLHLNNWYHMDVRPQNIVMAHDGTPRLIDWLTAYESDDGSMPKKQILFQGHEEVFWPDINLVSRLANWDLASFGLVICYLSLSPGIRELMLIDDERPTRLNDHKTANPESLAAIGITIYQMCSRLNWEVNYDDIESLLV